MRVIHSFRLIAATAVATTLSSCYVEPFQTRSEAKRLAVVAQEEALGDSLRQFRRDLGRFPTESEGLDALFLKPDGIEGWRGPYLMGRLGNDPWGHPYVYHERGRDLVVVVCIGADGTPGGTGGASDITAAVSP
jgi:general secretion pathway protein G